MSPTALLIKASRNEARQELLLERHSELAVRHAHQDSIVVVEDILEHGVLDSLNHKAEERALLLSAGTETALSTTIETICSKMPL